MGPRRRGCEGSRECPAKDGVRSAGWPVSSWLASFVVNEARATHLYFGLQDNVGVASVGQAKDAAKSVGREVANLEDFELWWLEGSSSAVGQHGAMLERTYDGTHVELFDFDAVSDDGRLLPLVESL